MRLFSKGLPTLGVLNRARADAVCLAGPGLVVRGGPECGSFGLGRGTHVV